MIRHLTARLRAWLHRTPGVTYADLYETDTAPFFADYRPDGDHLARLNEPAALPHQTRQGD
ncbi:hypothetical protein GCM10010406_21680 [Streptomyces thermolineatus]|uniref:Uncharacterized protein n=1 Tax=Streptomyces thermolineatus TaxID=44033 RepID=A0ABP5YV32_9ACTN